MVMAIPAAMFVINVVSLKKALRKTARPDLREFLLASPSSKRSGFLLGYLCGHFVISSKVSVWVERVRRM